jgi:hypothetical protein
MALRRGLTAVLPLSIRSHNRPSLKRYPKSSSQNDRWQEIPNIRENFGAVRSSAVANTPDDVGICKLLDKISVSARSLCVFNAKVEGSIPSGPHTTR